jgi:hypothetical protein
VCVCVCVREREREREREEQCFGGRSDNNPFSKLGKTTVFSTAS